MAEVVIFAGGFGSGKSEIVLNYVMQNKKSKNLVLADLDLVNPYFASRDLRSVLEEAGVRVVSPRGELSFGDVPSIPAEMIGILQGNHDVVIDLAGDEVGSLVLGYLSKYIQKREYEFYLVLNPYRPFAQDLESVMELQRLLEGAAHLAFTGIVSNPNLLGETTLETIRAGHEKVVAYAQSLKLPISCLAVETRFYNELKTDIRERLQAIQLYLKPDCW